MNPLRTLSSSPYKQGDSFWRIGNGCFVRPILGRGVSRMFFYPQVASLEVDILDKLDASLSRFLVWRLNGDACRFFCFPSGVTVGSQKVPTLELALLVRTHEPCVPTSRGKEYGADILDILDILDFFEGGGS